MVIDTLSNGKLYYNLGKNFEAALKWLENTDFLKVGRGRYDIPGTDAYAMVMTYVTVPPDEPDPETHVRYADIQYMARGSERFGYCTSGRTKPKTNYDEEHDVRFYYAQCDSLLLEEGAFFIAWPWDVHMPRCMGEKPEEVLKVVIKVRL